VSAESTPQSNSRHLWTSLSDSQLLAQVEVDTYRASGPGGQKRNKTSSAVRMRHPASGLIVIAEESRSQHENRVRALKRLRQAFFLKLREPLPSLEAGKIDPHGLLAVVRTTTGRLEVGRKDQRFWPVAGLVLDVLAAADARIADTARLLEISTGNLIDFLGSDPKIWEQANQLRHKFGHKLLIMSA
jgi:hypothetical protein